MCCKDMVIIHVGWFPALLFSLMQATGRLVNGLLFEILDWLSLASPVVHHFRLFFLSLRMEKKLGNITLFLTQPEILI